MKGEHLIRKVKELIHEGNVERIVINDADGKPVLDVPVTVGVIGLLVAPNVLPSARSARSRRTTRSTLIGQQPATTEPNARRCARATDRAAIGVSWIDTYVEWYKDA